MIEKIREAPEIISKKLRKEIWRLTHNCAPNAIPVYVVGVQRSGTSMFIKNLDRSHEIQCFSEYDPIAFENYQLRDRETIKKLVQRSPYKIVMFKPLTDSHRVLELMSYCGKGKAIWIYRRYQDRANSAVTKFSNHNLNLLRRIAQGGKHNMWQVRGLTNENIKLIKSFDYDTLSPGAAASIFWYIRNDLFFNQSLDYRDDVFMVSYENLVKNPQVSTRKVCKFLDCKYYPALVKGIHSSSIGRYKAPDVGDRIHHLCAKMYKRLEDTRLRKEACLI